MTGPCVLDRLYPEKTLIRSGVIVKVTALPARLLPELVEFFDSAKWLEISAGNFLSFGVETYPLLPMLEQSVDVVVAEGGMGTSVSSLPPELFPEIIETMVSLSLSLGKSGEDEGEGSRPDDQDGAAVDARTPADKLRDNVGRISVFLCNHGHPAACVREYPLSAMILFVDDLTGKNGRASQEGETDSSSSSSLPRHQTQAERYALMQAMNRGQLFNG